MRLRREIPFRWLLAGIFLGLMLVSTGAVSWFAYSGTNTAVRDLALGQVNASLDSVSAQTQLHFNPANRLLEMAADSLRNGMISTADPTALADVFARMLRLERGIDWIGFGYPDGRVATARSSGGKIYVCVSNVADGKMEMRGFGADGKPGALVESEPLQWFDARRRPWFSAAVDAPGVAWAGPYDFALDGRGISASLALRDASGGLEGVLFLDFTLGSITDFLDRLAGQTQSGTMVFLKDGVLLAESATGVDDEVRARVSGLLADAQQRELLEREGQVVFDEAGEGAASSIVALRVTPLEGGYECISAVAFNRQKTFGAVETVLFQTALAAAVVFSLSLGLAFFTAHALSKPLDGVTREIERIGNFDLESVRPTDSSILEIGILSRAVVAMRDGLKSFAHYVPSDIVRDLVKSRTLAQRGGERREVSIMFFDIEGFTSYAEKTTPEQAVGTLSACFDVFGRSIHRCGGVIDKFLGDGLMALFNAPSRIEGHAAAACRAALEALGGLNKGVEGHYVPRVRVGLHTGEALVGNVGTAERFSYTAIGDCVNLASRLEGLNKVYGTAVMASDAVRQAAGDGEFVWRALDRVAVVGRKEPLEVFELVGLCGQVDAERAKRIAVYEAALQFYFEGRFAEACAALNEITAEDSAARVMASRASELATHPPVGSWDGVFRATLK
jgi:adenylate cyclase